MDFEGLVEKFQRLEKRVSALEKKSKWTRVSALKNKCKCGKKEKTCGRR